MTLVQTPPKKIYMWVDVEYYPVNETFSYTWNDQTWTVPFTQEYIITCKWAGSNTSAWWLAQWTFTLEAWTVLKIMVWQSWYATSSWTYWFGWASNYGTDRSWWWLSWVFTWSWAIAATDSARALIIWWWAWWGQSYARAWWMWWWTEWQNWQGRNYWTAWWGWTQTGRNSWWNVWANQLNWWNGSWSYWWGGWGWWYWWNWSIWDSGWDDDKWAWGWSGYVKNTATNTTLTQWWWAAMWNNWSITIVSVNQ